MSRKSRLDSGGTVGGMSGTALSLYSLLPVSLPLAAVPVGGGGS